MILDTSLSPKEIDETQRVPNVGRDARRLYAYRHARRFSYRPGDRTQACAPQRMANARMGSLRRNLSNLRCRRSR